MNLISPYFHAEHATEWRGHEMPKVWHHCPEERWLWLDLLLDVQDRNLLGHQTSSLGAKCKSSLLSKRFSLCIFKAAYDFFSFFVSCRGGVTHLEAACAGSIISPAIQTAKTATEWSIINTTYAVAGPRCCSGCWFNASDILNSTLRQVFLGATVVFLSSTVDINAIDRV